MQEDDLKNKPYELLGQMENSQTPKTSVISEEDAKFSLVSLHICTMYYSALANIYMQQTLPSTVKDIDSENPRLKIAFERSYLDYSASKLWLSKIGADLIKQSSAKTYYDELNGMKDATVLSIDSFYFLKKK